MLVNINKRIQDFTIVANIGASYSGVTSKELAMRGLYEKLVFLICSMFTTLTTQKNVLRRWVGAKRPNLFFASAEVGWKSMLYLTVTGRNDWASQLTHSPQASFFYPSVGLSAVITEILKLPDWVDYLKVRGSFSSVGNPYPRFLTYPTYSYDANKQDWKSQTNYPIGKLYPERTDSWEVGLDATLFKDFQIERIFSITPILIIRHLILGFLFRQDMTNCMYRPDMYATMVSRLCCLMGIVGEISAGTAALLSRPTRMKSSN